LARGAKEDGIVTAAYRAAIPLYCPAVGDSSIGIGIAENRHQGKNTFTFDVIGDVLETAHLAGDAPNSGVIYFGGGTPRTSCSRRKSRRRSCATPPKAQVCDPSRNRLPALGGSQAARWKKRRAGENCSRRQHGHRALRFHHRHARPGFSVL